MYHSTIHPYPWFWQLYSSTIHSQVCIASKYMGQLMLLITWQLSPWQLSHIWKTICHFHINLTSQVLLRRLPFWGHIALLLGDNRNTVGFKRKKSFGLSPIHRMTWIWYLNIYTEQLRLKFETLHFSVLEKFTFGFMEWLYLVKDSSVWFQFISSEVHIFSLIRK